MAKERSRQIQHIMKSEYLSEVQLEQVQAVLKKYGIDSIDLLEELTDHYAGEIEEQMKDGTSFDQVFQKFVSENSWLKLRKLQHAHWKYSEQSLLKFVKGSLLDLYTSYRLIFVVLAGLALYFLFQNDTTESTILWVTLHCALIAQTFFIGISSYRIFRKYKSPNLKYIFQVSANVFYLLLMPAWWDSLNFFAAMVPGEAGLFFQMSYYMLVLHLAYVHHCLYERAIAVKRKFRNQAVS